MIASNALYDGKVIVPDQPLPLSANQRVRIQIETIGPAGSTGPRKDLSRWLGLGLPLPKDHTPRFRSNDDLWEKDK